MTINQHRNRSALTVIVHSGAAPSVESGARKDAFTKHDAHELLGRSFLIPVSERLITMQVVSVDGPQPADRVRFRGDDGSSYVTLSVADALEGWQGGFLQEV